MSRYLKLEVLFIHLSTGLLFGFLSGLLLWVAIDREPFLLILVVPITALCAWGWWMEWRAFPVRFGPPGR
jgi:hypothetical protein